MADVVGGVTMHFLVPLGLYPTLLMWNGLVYSASGSAIEGSQCRRDNF